MIVPAAPSALCWPLSRHGWMSTARTSEILPCTRLSGCCWITWGSALQSTTTCALSPTSARWLRRPRRCSWGSGKKVILHNTTVHVPHHHDGCRQVKSFSRKSRSLFFSDSFYVSLQRVRQMSVLPRQIWSRKRRVLVMRTQDARTFWIKEASWTSLLRPLPSSSPEWTLCVRGYILILIHFCCCTLMSQDWSLVFMAFQALFVKVVPYQCLGCVWSQRDKKENMSPTIRATITQFNTVTNQVIMSLLCQPTDGNSSPTSSRRPATTPAQRARIIEKWIRVAQVSRD